MAVPSSLLKVVCSDRTYKVTGRLVIIVRYRSYVQIGRKGLPYSSPFETKLPVDKNEPRNV